MLEVRGTDVVPLPLMMAHTALWVGLLYDAGARAAAWELTRRWPFDERLAFQAGVARSALGARSTSGALALDLARELLEIARGGLAAWARESGFDGRPHLDAASDIVASGKTLAERALAAWVAAGKDPQALVRFWQVA